MPAIRGRADVGAIGYAFAVACVILACVTRDARAATPPRDFYGVNAGRGLLDEPTARPAAFAAMRKGGMSYVRADASWDVVEPAPPVAGVHAYDWSPHDAFVADLARNGLRWYPMIGYSAPWAASVADDLFSPPVADADFASFAAALAARYGPDGTFWTAHPGLPRKPTTVYGIWNEPSNSMFWRGPDATPARYMRLYLAARAAIKAVDPDARVATGGLLDSIGVDANAYLQAMLASVPGERDRIDAVGWHPYVGDVDLVLASIWRARATLNELGLDGVPIEISEVGWHTGVRDATRAAWMRELAARLPYANMNVTRLLPYVWSGDEHWQMTQSGGTPSPLGAAYFAGIRDAWTSPPVAPTGRRAVSACVLRRRAAAQRAPRVKNCLPDVARTAARPRVRTVRRGVDQMSGRRRTL